MFLAIYVIKIIPVPQMGKNYSWLLTRYIMYVKYFSEKKVREETKTERKRNRMKGGREGRI